MSKERLHWADGMKAGSILAVVLYHTGIQAEVKSLAYLLCLPAFFYVAGLFADAAMDVRSYFRRRSLRLLIPYIAFGLLSWLAWLVIGRKYGSDAGVSIAWWEPLRGMLLGRSERLIQNGPLWFLCCLFIVEWIYYLIARLPSRWLWTATIGIAIAGVVIGQWIDWHLMWSIDTAMAVLPLYVAGKASRGAVEQLSNKTSVGWLLAAWIAAVIGVDLIGHYNADIKLSEGLYGQPVLFYIGEALVIAFWWLTALGIGRIKKIGAAYAWLGRNTQLILCMHLPLFGAIKGVLMIAGVPLSFYSTNEGSLLLWAGSITVCIPLIMLINRYLPFLAGKLQHGCA